MAQVLMFNISGEKQTKIRFLLLKMGVACREVPAAEFGQPLGVLIRRTGFFGTAEAPDSFSDEMLVLDGLSDVQLHGLLDSMRRVGASVALKAVVTEHNLRWSPTKLHRELAAEHAAMQTMGKGVNQK